MQWVQDPTQSNVDNLNNVRCEASRHFRNRKKEYLKAKINELESKIKSIRDLCRGFSDFKKGYQPRTNIVKEKKGDLVADSHSNLTRWTNYFSQILTFIVRAFHSAFGFTGLNFPLNRCACLTVSVYIL